MPSPLVIIVAGVPSPLSKTKLERIVRAGLKRFGKQVSDQRVELKFVRSPAMKKLNRQFRKKNRATDVLSFEIHRQGLLGSIVIDVQTARKQAALLKHSVRRECQELFVHGFLHLLGFDHQTKKQAHDMLRAQNFLNRLWTKP